MKQKVILKEGDIFQSIMNNYYRIARCEDRGELGLIVVDKWDDLHKTWLLEHSVFWVIKLSNNKFTTNIAVRKVSRLEAMLKFGVKKCLRDNKSYNY